MRRQSLGCSEAAIPLQNSTAMALHSAEPHFSSVIIAIVFGDKLHRPSSKTVARAADQAAGLGNNFYLIHRRMHLRPKPVALQSRRL